MLKYFIKLFYTPTQTITQILTTKPSYPRIIIFLFFIGLLRGIVENIWILLMSGQFWQVMTTPPLLKIELLKGGSFIFGNITTAYFRWCDFALITYIFGRFIGGRGIFEDFLRVYGLILGIFLITIIPNYLYLFWKLPMIQYNLSKGYKPTLGIGQFLTFIWLTFISYKVVRIIYKLPKIESLTIGFLVPLLNLTLPLLCSILFFNLPIMVTLSSGKGFDIANIVFNIWSLLMIPLLFWIGFKVDRRTRKRVAENF